jgi:hypothetical protein
MLTPKTQMWPAFWASIFSEVRSSLLERGRRGKGLSGIHHKHHEAA